MNDDVKEELKDCYAQISYLERRVDEQVDEIERLREALSKIIDATFYENTRKIRELASSALQQKESE